MSEEKLPIDVAAQRIVALAKAASNASRPLPFYWDVGQLVHAVRGRYGANVRKSLAAMLAEAGIDGLRKENLAKAAKFKKTIKREVAEQLEQSGVSWRNAAMLCSAYIDKNRTQLIDDVIRRRIKAKNLGTKIGKLAGIQAVSGARSIETAAERARSELLFLAKIAFKRGVSEDAKISAEAALIELKDLAVKLLDDRRAPTER